MTTLDRSLAVLEAVEGGARTLAEVAAASGLPRSTAHRLLRALAAHGYVSLEGGFGYRLGPRLLRMAARARRDAPLRDLAQPALERLAAVTGESAQLYVRAGASRVCVAAVESHQELRTIVPIGAELPLHAGSAAKVFLAFDPDPRRFLRRARDPERFARDVGLVRERGWAASVGERQQGVGSVSAPVRGPDGRLVAVVSVSGPAARMGRGGGRRYVPSLLRAASDIEAALAAV